MKFRKIFFSLLSLMFLFSLTACATNTSVKKTDSTEAATIVNPQLYRNFYEIFTASFASSKNNGQGDFAGIEQHLDYLNTGNPESTTDLKVNGIWLTPIYPSPTYHGYDVIDYEAVNPKFGTMTDFENLLAAAKKRGIAIILDLPINHTSTENAWFVKALAGDKKYVNYYNWSDSAKQGYNLASNGKYYESEFDKSMPDLNLDNPDVRAEITKITKFWLDKGVAGFRMDGMTYYYGTSVGTQTVKFASWLMTTIKSQDKNAYVVGEDWESETGITDLYASKIDSLFAFPNSLKSSNSPILNALMLYQGREFSDGMESWDTAIHQASKTAIDAPFLTNHDMDRAISFTNSISETKMAANAYLLLPGNPFIYYGEEIGMSGDGIDQNKRLPMVWNADGRGMPTAPEGSTETATTVGGSVDQQEANPNSLLNWYNKVLRIKAKYPEIASSRLKAIDTDQDSLSVLNYGNKLTIINNFDPKATLTLKLTGQMKSTLADSLSVTGVAVKLDEKTLTLPPYSTVILQ